MSFTFNLNYPEAPEYPVKETVTRPGHENLPPMPPYREGYSFAGWYRNPDANHPKAGSHLNEEIPARKYLFDQTEYNGILYAGWKEEIQDYTEVYRKARQLMMHYLMLDDAPYYYLFLTMYEIEFQNNTTAMYEMAKHPDEHFRPMFDQMAEALEEALAVMKGDDSDRLYDIWCDGPMPRLPEDFIRINGKETKGVAIQGCLEDDPGFRPFLVDMRLPEPEKAIGTAILSPSIRGGHGEGLKTARELNARGYNAFIVEPRYDRFKRGDKEFGRQNSYVLEILDVQRAVRFIKYNADKFGIDIDRLISVGFSKGNCIHYISSELFDLAPDEIPFRLADGEEVHAAGHETDDIDRIPATVSVNTLCYGDAVLTRARIPLPDQTDASQAEPSWDIHESRIYTKEYMEKGFLMPARFIVIGTGDFLVNFLLAKGLDANMKVPDKLYEVPWELHMYDKVPHGVGSGTQYENYGKVWDSADVFYRMNLGRKL